MPITGGLVGMGPVEYRGEKQAVAKAVERPTLREQLELRKKEYESYLAQVNDAIASLDEHPEVQAVLEKLSKLGY